MHMKVKSSVTKYVYIIADGNSNIKIILKNRYGTYYLTKM